MRHVRKPAWFLLLVLTAIPAASASETLVSNPTFHADRGVWQMQIASEFTSGKNVLEVLLPDSLDPKKKEHDKKYRVLFVLPVEAQTNHRYGDGIQQIRQMNIHNVHQVIVAAPTFDTLPWYGNHAENKRIRHEEYMVKVIVPLLDRLYPTYGDAEGRLLFGFSKSGWGAFILIARHPDLFGYAASWDAPLTMDESNLRLFAMSQHYGTKEQFAKFLPTRLLAANPEPFRKKKRLVLTGLKSFGPVGRPFTTLDGKSYCHTAKTHEFLEELNIPHAFDPKLQFHHSWNKDWMKPTLQMLLALPDEARGEKTSPRPKSGGEPAADPAKDPPAKPTTPCRRTTIACALPATLKTGCPSLGRRNTTATSSFR